MLPVCTGDLNYKIETDWVGHKIRSHPWRDQKLPISAPASASAPASTPVNDPTTAFASGKLELARQ